MRHGIAKAVPQAARGSLTGHAAFSQFRDALRQPRDQPGCLDGLDRNPHLAAVQVGQIGGLDARARGEEEYLGAPGIQQQVEPPLLRQQDPACHSGHAASGFVLAGILLA